MASQSAAQGAGAFTPEVNTSNGAEARKNTSIANVRNRQLSVNTPATPRLPGETQETSAREATERYE